MLDDPDWLLESDWAQAAAVIPNKIAIERISFFIIVIVLDSNIYCLKQHAKDRIYERYFLWPRLENVNFISF
jgi:hypothetical protein